MTMTMPVKAPTRPPKPERRKRRYTPLPDPPKKMDMAQHKHIVRAHAILEDRYANDPATLVSGEGYLLLNAGDWSRYVVPDCVIAFGVDAVEIEKANGYIISEAGKPPDFVLEVASKTTGVRDYTFKRRFYQDVGVLEYWRFDYTGGEYHDAPLAGDILDDGEYRRALIQVDSDGRFWGYSRALGLYLVWEAGNLRFYDPALGEFLPNLTETKRERDEAVRASEEADRRAAADRAARIEADRRADRANRRAESERAARAEADAARIAAERRAAEAEAELARLRRLLGDS